MLTHSFRTATGSPDKPTRKSLAPGTKITKKVVAERYPADTMPFLDSKLGLDDYKGDLGRIVSVQDLYDRFTKDGKRELLETMRFGGFTSNTTVRAHLKRLPREWIKLLPTQRDV